MVETGVPQGTARALEKVEGISRALKLQESVLRDQEKRKEEESTQTATQQQITIPLASSGCGRKEVVDRPVSEGEAGWIG